MNSRLTLSVGVTALALSGVAYADDSAQFELGMSAQVDNTCFIADTPTANGLAAFTAGGSGPTASLTGNTVVFPAMANPVTATPNWPDYAGGNWNTAAATKINFTAVCNFANSTVQMTTAKAGMRLESPPASVVGQFADAISYGAQVSWNGSVVGNFKTGPSNPGPSGNNLVTAPGGSSPAFNVMYPTNANMQLNVRPFVAHEFGTGARIKHADRGDYPLLAGTYSDTLTLRFGAAP